MGYNHSTYAKAGKFIYTSYHSGMFDKEGNTLNTIEEQTEQCFKELTKTLKAAGASLDDIIKTTVYLRHRDAFDEKQEEFRKMDKVYKRFFPSELPVRTTLWISFFGERCFIQIGVVAYKNTP